jgi:hypothetical protein
MLANPANLAVIFTVILHAILVASAFGIIALIYGVIAKFPAPAGRLRQEVLLRSIAATAGILLVLGSRSVGVSVPALMLNALLMGGYYMTGVIGSIVPAAAGFAVAWIVINRFNSRNEFKNLVSVRLLAMLLAVVLVLYCDGYALGTDAAHDGVKLLLPNLTFTLAALILAVFKFNPMPEAPAC